MSHWVAQASLKLGILLPGVYQSILDMNTLLEQQCHPPGDFCVSLLLLDTCRSVFSLAIWHKYFCFSDHIGSKFDIDMLVSLLRQENARDICVIKVPPEMKYTDYFVVGSGTSSRHLHAMAYYIVKMVGCCLLFWFCFDLENIVSTLGLDNTWDKPLWKATESPDLRIFKNHFVVFHSERLGNKYLALLRPGISNFCLLW